MPLVTATILPAAAASVAVGHASSEMVTIPIWLEMLAIITASICGALTAREKKLDLIGAIAMAVLCSVGGGLLRDMVLQVGDVYILNQPLALPISILSAMVTFLIPSVIGSQDRLIAVLDIFAVGLYGATGADKAMAYGFNPLICVMMGFFTAVGGGMLRDIFLGETPTIFKRGNFYAIAAIAGASLFVILAKLIDISHMVALVACVAVTMGLRYLSVHYDIQSPAEIDLTETLRHPRRRERGAAAVSRQETSTRATEGLEDRRERVQADIEKRRRQEHRRARRLRWQKKRNG